MKERKFSNWSSKERKALISLRKRDDIVNKTADKGGAVVIWLHQLYLDEVSKQLSDQWFYEKLASNQINDDQQQVKSMIARMINGNELPPCATNLVVTTPQMSSFHLLPKIPKPGNPGRPIVSACSCPTENIAVFLDEITATLVCNLQTYVKDTKHTLQIFDEFCFGDGEHFLFPMDIKSLYAVIPNNDGLCALAQFLDKREVKDPSTATLTCLAELVLTLNAFSFNGNHYRQVSGIAIPNYGCLFVGFVEEQMLNKYSGFIPQLYRRYIDDVVGAAYCAQEDLNNFIEFDVHHQRDQL